MRDDNVQYESPNILILVAVSYFMGMDKPGKRENLNVTRNKRG